MPGPLLSIPLVNWSDPRWSLYPLHHHQHPLRSGYRKPRARHLPHFIGGASSRWRRSRLFSARCTQCPRVTAVRVCTSNNASRGAGRACSRLGHCGSLRARGACFASEPRFPKSLHHSVVGRRDGDLGVPIGFQHFPGPWRWEGSRDPGFLIIIMGRLKF